MATTNLLPGPASTQLAIYCAWRLRGTWGALVGGMCFIVPGLIVILALSALFLSSHPPRWVGGAAGGAGAAVPAVALGAAIGLAPASWRRAGPRRACRGRWIGYLAAGGVSAALIGPFLVLVLAACGLAELLVTSYPWRPAGGPSGADASSGAAARPPQALLPLLAAAVVPAGGLLSVAWWRSRSARCPTAAASSSSRSCSTMPCTPTTG